VSGLTAGLSVSGGLDTILGNPTSVQSTLSALNAITVSPQVNTGPLESLEAVADRVLGKIREMGTAAAGARSIAGTIGAAGAVNLVKGSSAQTGPLPTEP
jgi:hypothetical protein